MQIILIPGVIAGIALGIAFMLINGAGESLSYGVRELLGLAAMLAAVMAAEAVALRRHPLGREATFGARYFTAMFAGMVVAVTYGIVAWIGFAVIDPDYLARFYAEYVERARATGNPELVAGAEQMKPFILDPLSQAMVQFGTTLLFAVLGALATAALVRPKSRGLGAATGADRTISKG